MPLCCALAAACTEPRFADTDAAREQASDGGSGPDQLSETDSSVEAGAVGPEAIEGGMDTGQAAVSGTEGGVGPVEDAGPADGATPEDAAHPRAEWLGRYAMRAYAYNADEVFLPVGMLAMLVEIRARGADLELVEWPCVVEVQGSWNGLVPSSFRYEAPDGVAPSTSTLVLDGDTFSTAFTDYALGYDLLPPAECVPGATIPRREVQSGWLPSTCDCPLDVSVPPTDERDCRVTDPERDGDPGATVKLLVSTDVWTYFVVQHRRARYVDGYRARNGWLHANVDARDVTRALGCLPPALSSCPIAPAEPCPAHYNKAEFTKLEEPYDCKRVVRELDSLFMRDIPAFPLACLADL